MRWWGFGMAVASAGPYANNLHLAPDRQPHQHLITQIFIGRMLFLMPSHVRALKATQSIEGSVWWLLYIICCLLVINIFMVIVLKDVYLRQYFFACNLWWPGETVDGMGNPRCIIRRTETGVGVISPAETAVLLSFWQLIRHVSFMRICDCCIFCILPHFSHISAKCACRIFLA